MADNSKKLSQLPSAPTLAATDKVLVLYQAATGAPSTRTANISTILASLSAAPGNTTVAGYIGVDGNTVVANATGFISINTAVITSNNTLYVGSVSATNVVSNAQLIANLTNYQTTAGLASNVASYLPIYTGIVNGASYTVGSNFIANSTVLTFTPNTFNLGSVSKTANGYVWLPNGVLCQWGPVLANTTTGNATFTIAFPTACQSVNFSVIGSANVAYQSAAPNTTVATIRTSSTTTAISVQYKAIGY
jgi:hypothetical protein